MEEQWLTYVEAAQQLGIKIDSVKRRARARHWARRTNNGGIVQVAIPSDILAERRSDAPPDDPHSISVGHPPPSAHAEAEAQRARADALAEQVKDLRAERDRLLTIIENQSRPIDVRRHGILDRIERFLRR